VQLGPWGNDVHLRALGAADVGMARWSATEWFAPNRPPALAKLDADGTLAIVNIGHAPGAEDNCLIVHRASDGKLIRAPRVDLTGWITGTPAVADFRHIGACDVAVSTWDDPQIALIDGRSGEVLWRQRTDRPNMGGVAAADLDSDGLPDAVATSFDGHVYALRGRDGRLLWKTESDQYISRSLPTVVGLNGKGVPQVLVTAEGQLFVLNGGDGSLLWSPGLNGNTPVAGRAVVAGLNGGTVILAPMGGLGVVAFDWQSRKELWRSPEGRSVIASPVVTDFAQDGTWEVVMGTTEGDVFVLDLASGKPLWHSKVGQDLIEADPVVADLDGDGIGDVLIADHDFHLYAISGRRILDAMGRR
jgi:outer membrane protein assembly factor BamB